MGGGSDTTSTTQSQSTTQLPPWVNTAAQQNYGYAQNVATQPLQQYQGQTVAGVAPQMQQAWNTAASGANAGADQYNASQAAYLGVLGQQPQQVTPGQLSSTNLQPYMNPYTQNVINSTLPIMQQQLGLQQNQQQNAANAANAFGGSRQAVQQGVTQAQGAMGMGQMAAQLNQANFGQAQAAAQQDIQTSMAAQQANQAAQQNQANLNLQAAGGLGVLGQQAQLSQTRNFTEQQTAGALEQQQAQNEINANLAAFQQAQQYPYQQLGVLQSALGMTPYGQATQGQSTTQTQQAANPLGQALGGVQALGSLFGGGGMFGPQGAFSGVIGGQSDRREKTDIKRVDTHPSGLPIYAYRYKGDPKHYPKIMGPMAEDVAKVAPHAVRPMGVKGRLAVDMNALPGGTPSIGALRPGPPPMGLPPRGPQLPAPAMGRGVGPAMGQGMGPIAAGPPLMGRGIGPRMGQGMGPPVPGPLAGPGVAGAIGALGAPMRGRPKARGKMRPPPLRGALGG
jgi:hypothetical protein